MDDRKGILNDILIHDVDTHIAEAPDLWTSRVSSKWGDDVPHVVTNRDTGIEAWYIGDSRVQGAAQMAIAGWREPTPSYPPTFAEANPATWDAKPRLAYMDEQGIYSHVLYPNILGFIHSSFMKLDPELRLACVRAYNDYQAEFCAEDPNRLIGLTYLPWWDLDASVAELERCAQFGNRGVTLAWEFERLGLPRLRDPYWEPLLRTIEDMRLPISFHVGFGSSVMEDRVAKTAKQEQFFEKQGLLDIIGITAIGGLGNSRCITELIMGKVCQKFPELKFVSVESGIGYIPFLLEYLDYLFMNTAAHRENTDMLLPSEYFKRQIYGTFWFESDVAVLADRFPDNFMFESDFPHPQGLAPGPGTTTVKSPLGTIAANLGSLPDDLVVKLLQDNAATVYGVPAFATAAV